MKKAVSFILIIIMAVSVMCVAVSAEGNSKISEGLQKIISEGDPDERINVIVWLPDIGLKVEDMPSYPDIPRARKELKALMTEQEEDFLSMIPADIEYMCYRSPSLLSTHIVMTLRLGDIERIAGIDLVESIKEVPYYGPEPTGDVLKDKFSKWVYEEWGIKEYDPQAAPEPDGAYTDYRVLYTCDDWTLIHAELNNIVPWQTVYNLEFCGRVVPGITGSSDSETAYPYFVYDSQSDSFKSIYAITNEDRYYPELWAVINELKIGRPIGDSDGDGELTILDATNIQRALAGLTELDPKEDAYWIGGDGGRMRRWSDPDADGEVTVLDATAIQRKLAGIV